MSSLSEIEAAITQLSEAEVRTLLDWLQTYLDNTWDCQIKADLQSGRLDRVIQRVEADIIANRVKPLDEIINNS